MRPWDHDREPSPKRIHSVFFEDEGLLSRKTSRGSPIEFPQVMRELKEKSLRR